MLIRYCAISLGRWTWISLQIRYQKGIRNLTMYNSTVDTPTFNKLSNELAMVKAENARYIERIKELTAELEFYKIVLIKFGGSE